jgi:conjugal transfer ATP-binding protein TraC
MKSIRDIFKKIVSQEEHKDQDVKFEPRTNASATYPRWSDVLPYWAYDTDSQLLLLVGQNRKVEGLGALFSINPIISASENTVKQLMECLFEDLPPNSGFQFHLIANPDLSGKCQNYKKIRERRLEHKKGLSPISSDTDELLNTVMDGRISFYLKGTEEPPIPRIGQKYLFKDFSCYLSVVYPINLATHEDEAIEIALEEHKIKRDRLLASLSALGLLGEMQDRNGLVSLASKLMNPVLWLNRNYETLNPDPLRPIGQQIVRWSSHWDEYEDHFKVRDLNLYPSEQPEKQAEPIHREVEVSVLFVEDYPERFFLNGMQELIGSFDREQVGFSCPVVITSGIIATDPDQMKMLATLKKQDLERFANGPLGRWSSETRDHLTDWTQAFEETQQGTGLAKTYMSVLLLMNTTGMSVEQKNNQRLKNVENARNVFKSQGFKLEVATHIQKLGVLAHLPMMLSSSFQWDLNTMKRLRTVTAWNSCCLIPIMTESAGIQISEPKIVLFGRRGQWMNVDLFANTSGNFNAIVTGASGSGKSTFMNAIAMTNIETGGQDFIVDVGRSYKKQVDMIRGQYIEFTEESRICINPLTLLKNPDEDLDMIAGVVAQMASPKQILSTYQQAQLEAAIYFLFTQKENGAIEWLSIDDLSELLIHNRCLHNEEPFSWPPQKNDERYVDTSIREIGISLRRYTKEGVFGRFFYGQNNVNFEDRMVVLELEELNQKPDLQSVVLLILMQQITQTMYLGDRGVKKLLMIDEAWDLFRDGSMMASMIEKSYRRARKYGGACVTGTQSINDYFKNATTLAALNSSDWMFCLRENTPALSLVLQNLDQASREEQETIFRSLKTVEGQYSEIMIRCAGRYAVGRHILSPFDLLLYSSKAEDFIAIQHYREQGLSMKNSILKVLEDRGLATSGVSHD